MVKIFRPESTKDYMPQKRIYIARVGARHSQIVSDDTLNRDANEIYMLGLKIAEPVVFWDLFEASQLQPDWIPSRLKGHPRYLIFVSTLGPRIDEEIENLGHSSVLRAHLLDAWASEALEKLNDTFENWFRKTYLARTTRRFSPGYEDLHITVNKHYVALLGLQNRINVLSSGVMIPRKTTTCIVGLEENS
ncbi:methionine synthase [Fervidobacterium thailandense]|nr:methionine synthase [Fervidobacterium thailandense]